MEYFLEEKPNRAGFHRQLDVNTAAVLVITQVILRNVLKPLQVFLPLLEKAAKQVKTEEFSVDRAAIINISSTLGSIENNNGEWRDRNMTIFRVSKVVFFVLFESIVQAALNALTRDLSFEVIDKGILIVSLCPGKYHGSFCGNGTNLNREDRLKVEQICELRIKIYLDGKLCIPTCFNHVPFWKRRFWTVF